MTYFVKGIECRTREESLRHIAQQAKLKKIGPKTEAEEASGYCQYHYGSGNNCAVGSLFSKAQIQDLKTRGCNDSSIGFVSHYHIGKRNIETITGMKVSELQIIQQIHDETLQNHNAQAARDGVRIYCEKELEKLQAKKAKTTSILRENPTQTA